jgi:hypothetical protein
MQKQAKVTKQSYFTKDGQKVQGKYGYSVSVEFDNGDKGWFSTKFDTCNYFAEGKTVDYVIEEKPKKDGTGVTHIIKLPPKDKAESSSSTANGDNGRSKPSFPNNIMRSIKDMKFEARMMLMQTIIPHFIEGKIDSEKALSVLKEWITVADDTIDDLNNESKG